MGKGLAQFITFGSIALTVASLALAVLSARSRSRIRPTFDVLRAVVGVGAILIMAVITGVTTPVFLVGLAIVFGTALGFAQGANLRVDLGDGGLFARRNPVGIVMWGAGIVVMQAAGIAARTGGVQFGQSVAWFSACIGIGLMVGRRGPMAEARTAPSRVAAAAAAGVVGMALVAPALPTSAQISQLTDEEVCDLLPGSGTFEVGSLDGGSFPELAPGSLGWSSSGPDTVFDVSELGVTAACVNTDDHVIYDGTFVSVAAYQFPSDGQASSALESFRVAAASALIWPELNALPPVVDAPTDAEREVLGDEAWIARFDYFDVVAFTRVGPFLVGGLSEANQEPEHRDVMIERTGEAVANIEELVGEPVVQPDPDTTEPDPDTTEPPVSIGPGTGTDDDDDILPPVVVESDADEPIEPREAAGQAVAGAAAAVAIAAITLVEAAGGSSGSGPDRGQEPPGPEEPPGPFIDPYDQKPLPVDPGTGMVWWPWDGRDGQWVDPQKVPALIDGWNRELDTETARRVAVHDAQRERNWSDLQDKIRRSDAEDAARRAAEKARTDAFDGYVAGAEGWMEEVDANSLGVLDRIRQRVAEQGYATDADIAEARRIANDSRTYWDTMQRMGAEDWVRINNNQATIVEATAKAAAAVVNPIAAGAVFGVGESMYDGKGAVETIANGAMGAGLGWAGAAAGAWQPGKAALGNLGWGAASGAGMSAAETLIRGGTWEDAWTAGKVGFVAGGGGGLVENVTTGGRPPPPDLPTATPRAGGSGGGYDGPFGPRPRSPQRPAAGVPPGRGPSPPPPSGRPPPPQGTGPVPPRQPPPPAGRPPPPPPAGRPPVDVPGGRIPGSKSDWSKPPPKIIETEGPLGGRLPVDPPDGRIPGSRSDWSKPPPKIIETEGPLGRPPTEPPPPARPPVDVPDGPIPGSQSDWSKPPPKIIETEGPLGRPPPPERPPPAPTPDDGRIPGSKSNWSEPPPKTIETEGVPSPEPPPVSPADATGTPPPGDLPDRTPPTPEQLRDTARSTMDGSEIAERMMDQPRQPGSAVEPKPPASVSPGAAGGIDIDADGRFVVGGRQVGSLDPDTGMLTNSRGERILIAMDDRTGMPVGYLEQPDVPPGMSPTYNSRGELAGYVDRSGRAMIDGEPTPVALDADGNFVPYDAPSPAGGAGADAPPEGFAAPPRASDDPAPATGAGGGPRRTEVEPPTGAAPPPTGVTGGERTEIPNASEVDLNPRIPVLDADGAPTKYIEPGPREIQYDADGVPRFAQRTFPAQPAIQRGGGISAPVQEAFDSSVEYYPLTGENAPPSAPRVGGSDPAGGDAP